MTKMEVTRRKFMVTTAAVGGGLAFGFTFPNAAQAAVIAGGTPWYGANPFDGTELNAWIVVQPDNKCLIRVGQSEMGQGVFTALPMLVAEELECGWDNVVAEFADANRSIREGNIYQRMGTGGSGAVRNSRPYLQLAGATAREMLKEAAAQMWGVSRADLTAENGVVAHAASGQSATFGELAPAAAGIELGEEPAIKTPDQFTLLGQPLHRLDQGVKTTGQAIYGIDVKLPNMVYAATATCPVMGGRVVSYDASAVADLPGVVAVVEFGAETNNPLGLRNGVAVVADTYWRARTALAALPIEWDLGDGATVNSSDLHAGDLAALDAAEPGGVADGGIGDVQAAFTAAAMADPEVGGGVIEADYSAPYQAHATMEPLNCTAQVAGDRVDIWMGTQNPPNALAEAAEIAGVDPENTFVHTCFLGGGFGGRIRPEAATAVAIAQQLDGRPVKVIWSREDDMMRDWFDPRIVSRFKATLGDDGLPNAIYNRSTGDSIFGWINPNAVANGVDFIAIWGINNMPYSIPNKQFEFTMRQSHHPVHFLRAPGHNHNIFMVEGFIDELAHAAGQDPIEYRLQMLSDLPEWANVLIAARDRSNWRDETYPGFGRGVGIGEAFGSIVASVAEVSVSRRGQVTVERVDCAIDCLHVANPHIIHVQTESCIVYGLSMALNTELTFNNGVIQQQNFDTYPVMRMADMPEVHTHLVPRGGDPDTWGGIGEVALPPSVAAVANAIFDATGHRVRSMPFRRHDLSWG
jgi:isoquinoline 1-oxidoreductase beta subunit